MLLTYYLHVIYFNTFLLYYSFLIETWWRGLNKSDTFNGFLRDLAIVF